MVDYSLNDVLVDLIGRVLFLFVLSIRVRRLLATVFVFENIFWVNKVILAFSDELDRADEVTNWHEVFLHLLVLRNKFLYELQVNKQLLNSREVLHPKDDLKQRILYLICLHILDVRNQLRCELHVTYHFRDRRSNIV